jgi:tetratricopeptide (TPR) repeat protein
LASVYIELGKNAEASKLNLQSILESLKDPEDRTRAKGVIAALAGMQKDFATAEQMYLEVLSFWQDPSRAASSATEIATSLNNLGVIALWQRRPELANARLEQGFQTWERILGPANPTLAKAMANVAHSCMELKEYQSAAQWLARAKAIAHTALGELHPFTVGIAFAQADALNNAGRKAEAKEIKRAASEARKVMRSPSTADYTIDYREIMSLRSRNRTQ